MNALKAQRTTTVRDAEADATGGSGAQVPEKGKRVVKSYVGAGDLDAWLRDNVGGRKVDVCDDCGQSTYWL